MTANQQLALPTLGQLEERIERGLDTFVDVGLALMEVRDRRLYRESDYQTFEKYCVGRWKFHRAHAYRLIDSAITMKALSDGEPNGDLSPIGDIPVNESQARELAPLAKSDPDAAREVWQQVNEEHNGDVTAAKVREAVRERMPEPKRYYGCAECGEGWTTKEAARDCCLEDDEIIPATNHLPPLPDGPTPHEMARTDPGRRWSKVMHDLHMTLNSIRDNGGIKELARRWTDQDKRAVLQELDRVMERITESRTALEATIGDDE